MNYTKPEITSLASASLLIQGAAKTAGRNDSISPATLQSVPAYEADE